MRLTFFHHSLIVGSGIDTGIYELARRIGRHHAVTVLTFASDYDSLAPAELRILPTSIVPRSRAGVVGALDPAARRVARDFLRTQDVVNIHTYPANLIAYRVQGPRHVATEWGAVDASLFPRASEQAYIRVATWAEKRYCRSADLVVCPCAFTARWTSAHFQVSPAVTLLDGINFEVFDRSRVDPRIILERFPSLRPGPVLLTVVASPRRRTSRRSSRLSPSSAASIPPRFSLSRERSAAPATTSRSGRSCVALV